MKDKVTISETGIMTIGQQAAKEGFKGKVSRLSNFHTQTLVRPGATLDEVKESLELILQDVEARIKTLGKEEEF